MAHFVQFNDVTKTYRMGETSVDALSGMSFEIDEGELVVILGPSGAGKTTLLNLLGGMDTLTSGEITVAGVSLSKLNSRQLTLFRRHDVGFVFQFYNLMPNLTARENIELATEICKNAVSPDEALKLVGLTERAGNFPAQLSGGEQQRVSIARAVAKNPKILLCDEPTGALDSETSVQIMELLKEISHEKLIIMVTHNPDLAARYATRTIRLLDGSVVDDSDPYVPPETPDVPQKKPKKTSMSFFTALGLSLNNLMTKKTRTLLTAFAGSIGIIGIALIISLSTGVNKYIADMERDFLRRAIEVHGSVRRVSELFQVNRSTIFRKLQGSKGHDKDEDAGSAS